MGAWTRTDTLSGREALSIRKQPAWRGAPSPNGGSGGRIRRAGRWLRFKSLMHRLAGQWQRGCGGGGCDRSAGEQCPVRLTDSSSGPAEAPASAPEGALSCGATRHRHEARRGGGSRLRRDRFSRTEPRPCPGWVRGIAAPSPPFPPPHAQPGEKVETAPVDPAKRRQSRAGRGGADPTDSAPWTPRPSRGRLRPAF